MSVMAKKSEISDKEISKVMSALVRRRWAKTSSEARSQELSKVAKARWSKKGAKKNG